MNSATINGTDFASITYPDGKFEQVIDARLYEIDIASVIGVLEVIKHNIIQMHNNEE